MRTIYSYKGGRKWTSGRIKYDIQTNYDIKLDDVKCTRGEWPGSCYYSEIDDCGHNEDVFLSCHGNLIIYRVFIEPLTTM